MSMTLNLVERLVARGRRLQQLGLEQEAIHCWDRLAKLRELPAEVAREAQTQLAEIHLGRHKYVRARRYLTAAVASQPGNAHFHYLLARAIEADQRGDRCRALSHYRRAMELDPEQAQYLCGFGVLAIEIGDDEEEGASALSRALQLAPDNPDVVEKVLEGLRQVDPEQARNVARAALFRNPRHPRFRRLWNQLHFQCLHDEQARAANVLPVQQGPTLLPFVRPEAWNDGTRKIRRDPPSRPARPHLPVSYSGKKHA